MGREPNHRLRGSASPVLTATGFVNEKDIFSFGPTHPDLCTDGGEFGLEESNFEARLFHRQISSPSVQRVAPVGRNLKIAP